MEVALVNESNFPKCHDIVACMKVESNYLHFNRR